jgi:hypothetical protein
MKSLILAHEIFHTYSLLFLQITTTLIASARKNIPILLAAILQTLLVVNELLVIHEISNA